MTTILPISSASAEIIAPIRTTFRGQPAIDLKRLPADDAAIVDLSAGLFPADIERAEYAAAAARARQAEPLNELPIDAAKVDLPPSNRPELPRQPERTFRAYSAETQTERSIPTMLTSEALLAGAALSISAQAGLIAGSATADVARASTGTEGTTVLNRFSDSVPAIEAASRGNPDAPHRNQTTTHRFTTAILQFARAASGFTAVGSRADIYA